jgi:hypothetical protein
VIPLLVGQGPGVRRRIDGDVEDLDRRRGGSQGLDPYGAVGRLR